VAVIVLHVVARYQFGATAETGCICHVAGWRLEMLRPRMGLATLDAHPMMVVAAGAAALLGGCGCLATDGLAHAPLVVVDPEGDPAPALDGRGEDAVQARAASVVAAKGENLPDRQSRVEVQAAVDDERISTCSGRTRRGA
jgi:hypothetical protein